MGVREVLISARSRIADPDNWCQFTGMRHGPTGRIQMCAHQAIMADCYGHMLNEASRAIQREIHGQQSIASYNDTHSHYEVIALFDRAIKKLTPVPVTDHEYTLTS